MRIAIDARMMGPETTRGIGRYIEELIGAMLEVAPEHQYILVTRRADHRFASHPSVETVVADVPWYGLAEQFRMARIFAKIHPDVLHIPHWNVPVLYGCPYVITIHDLILRHAPESAKASTRIAPIRWIKRLGYRLVIARAIRQASAILVPTDFVARDVASFYPDAKGKIRVTGEGMPALQVRGASSVVRGSSHAPRTTDHAPDLPYLLYVGAAYPHKGLQDLLTAWPKISILFPKLRLKVAGEKDAFMRAHETRVEQEKLRTISFHGRVAEDELLRLYDGALAFIYPTHLEGFGLPALEALARGCPVLSSNAEPLPDVLGKDGAIFFQSGEPNAILGAVQELMRDPLRARQNAASAGPSLAERHDWKRAAACTLGAYGDPHYHCSAWHEG